MITNTGGSDERQARLQQFIDLRRRRYTVAQAAVQLRVSPRTAQRYEVTRKAEGRD